MTKNEKDDLRGNELVSLKSVYENKSDDRELRQAEEINNTLFAISNAVNTNLKLNDLYHYIHLLLGRIIDVTNFFIALFDNQERKIYFPYHVDTKDDDFSSVIDFETDSSLTGLVIKQRKAVLLNKSQLEKRDRNKGIWGPVPLTWMGVPLMKKGMVIGVIAVQSYTDADLFTQRDVKVLSAVSNQVAIAIDRQRSYEALEKSEQRFRQLFDQSNDAIIIHRKGEIIDSNKKACDMLGYSNEQLVKLKIGDIENNDKQTIQDRIECVISGEAAFFESEWKTSDGRLIPVEISSSTANKQEGIIQSIGRDISQRIKDNEARIKALQYAKEQEKHALVGQVAGKMAHDFNNILSIIMGNTELALLENSNIDNKKTFELILEQALRGRNLTRNLVAFAKDQELHQEFFNINEKLDLVLELLKKDLENIGVIKDYQSDIPELLADAGMIEHAIVNLLQNSIHATSKGKNPIIMVRTYCLDNKIIFEIEDNGCGIPKEHEKNIYTPSFTLKGSKDLTGSYDSLIKGTGYGMSNVKKYIEQHKGSIRFNTEFLKGTTFTISLPLIYKELSVHEKNQIIKAGFQSGKYILVVEDEDAISNVFYQLLTNAPFNHHVDIAANGEDALNLLNRNNYDLLSLDYVLPGDINGMDIYHHIRESNKVVPILFVSGNIEFLESIKELKREDSKIDHISKPCLNKDYLVIIGELLEK